jgi:predicted transcriptional regulator
MESYGLMFELSHPERLKMLKMLSENHMRLSQISNNLEVTTAEVSRHLDRLTKARLIERDSDNFFRITPFANIVLSEYSNFEFLTKNLDYFINHNMTLLPAHLHWFNFMSKGEFVTGTLEISSMIKETSVNAKKHIRVISEEVMRGLVELDCKRNDEGISYRKIYPKDAEFPDEYTSRLGDNFEIKTLDYIPLALKMSEKMGGLVLRDMSGKVDYSCGIVGEDQEFMQWIEAVFDYFWKKAKPLPL